MPTPKPKIQLCETCKQRAATVSAMVVRDGKRTYAHFCEQCYEADRKVPRSLQDMIADLEGRPRDET
jgi:protein-arginine kinase activator protein McsA